MDKTAYKILIVEDDKNTAKYIQTCLSMGQYQSEVCDNGLAAINLLSERIFDLILLDIMLPGIDGLKYKNALRQKIFPLFF